MGLATTRMLHCGYHRSHSSSRFAIHCCLRLLLHMQVIGKQRQSKVMVLLTCSMFRMLFSSPMAKAAFALHRLISIYCMLDLIMTECLKQADKWIVKFKQELLQCIENSLRLCLALALLYLQDTGPAHHARFVWGTSKHVHSSTHT